MRRLDSITDSGDRTLSKLWEMVTDREVWRAPVHEAAESDATELLNNEGKARVSSHRLRPHFTSSPLSCLCMELSALGGGPLLTWLTPLLPMCSISRGGGWVGGQIGSC